MATSMEQLDLQIHETRERLYELRVSNKKRMISSQTSREESIVKIQILNQRTQALLRETSSLQVYLQAIRKVMSGTLCPQYVQTLQARVCQTVHMMCTTDDYFAKLQASINKSRRKQRHLINKMRDEATQEMLMLLNEISLADTGNVDLKEAYLDVMKAQSKVLRFLDTQVMAASQDSYGSLNIPIQGRDGEVLELVAKKRNCSRSNSQRNIMVNDLVSFHMRQYNESFANDLDVSLTSKEQDASFPSPVSVIPTKLITSNEARNILPPGLILEAST